MGTHWRRLACADSPFLHVWDVDGRTPLTVTIEKAGPCSYKGDAATGEEDTPGLAVWFKGGKKPLGVKATNGQIIEAMHGKDIEGWAGKPVTIRTATCMGEPCIRLDAPAGTKFGKRVPKFQYTDKKPAQVTP
jgi:hypothetical protein